MDYPNKRRIKIWGKAKVVFDDKELFSSLSDPSYNAKVERAIIFTVEAWDSNCPQHIKQRFTQEDILEITDPLNKRIQELEDILQKNGIQKK